MRVRSSRRRAVALLLLLAAATACSGGDDRTPAAARSAAPATTAPATAPLPSASAEPSAAPSPTDARPVAEGSGTPDCNGACKVENRLTRAFLPRYAGTQTLLLSSSTQEDENGNFLHAFLVDGQGRVLWQEHGFGWSFRRVDERFAIRFDDAGHVFFRTYVADFTYLYVLHTTGDEPRLVGPPDGEPTDGFQEGELVERPGEPAFRIRESVVDCPEDGDTPVEACPRNERTYRWDGTQYVEAS